jgi:DNA-binding transcriptional ArsR family regulator
MSVERVRPALRAIRREPLLLDDAAVAGCLDGMVAADVARWARAWLICWFAALSADERFGRLDPWEIPLHLDAIALPRGAGEGSRQRAVLDALVAAGIATVRDERHGRRSERLVQLARAAFVEHPSAIAVDWSVVVARCGAEPAALLVVRALVELIVPLDAWSAVPRRDLVARTGYQQKQVRLALRRLVAADLVNAEGDVGTTARYRLTPRALGRAWPAEDHSPAAPSVAAYAVEPPPPASPATPPTAVPAEAAPTGVQVVIGGATVTIASGASFEIGAGVSARLEIGPDGRPRLVVAPPR